jgi:hypothetical protein
MPKGKQKSFDEAVGVNRFDITVPADNTRNSPSTNVRGASRDFWQKHSISPDTTEMRFASDSLQRMMKNQMTTERAHSDSAAAESTVSGYMKHSLRAGKASDQAYDTMRKLMTVDSELSKARKLKLP